MAYPWHLIVEFWMWVTKDSISFFTFVLAIVAGGQGWLIWRQIKLARDEFNATHRPRIHVRSVSGPIPRGEGGSNFRVLVVNLGEAKATITAVKMMVYDAEERGNAVEISCAPPTFGLPIHLAIGESKEVIRATVRDVEYDMLDAVFGTFLITAVITYSAGNRASWKTGIARVSARGEPFRVSKDWEEEEYED